MHCCLSEETSKAYNLAVIQPFDNHLDTELLTKAWNLLCLAQDALRFKIDFNGGQPELYLIPYQYLSSIHVIEVNE